MAETLTQKIERLLSEAEKRSITDPLESFILIQQTHKMLSEINGFRRANQDFITARNVYQERVFVLLCDIGIEIEEGLDINISRYFNVLCSPQERGKIDYNTAMNP